MHDYPPGSFGYGWFYKTLKRLENAGTETPLHPGVREELRREMNREIRQAFNVPD
jgi:hypothetical protein